jgi:phosphate/sulfate permease
MTLKIIAALLGAILVVLCLPLREWPAFLRKFVTWGIVVLALYYFGRVVLAAAVFAWPYVKEWWFAIVALSILAFIIGFVIWSASLRWFCPKCARKVETLRKRFCTICNEELGYGRCMCHATGRVREEDEEIRTETHCASCNTRNLMLIPFWRKRPA